MSKPITRLSEDAELICQLRLGAVKQLFSRIKEISHMADTFMKMKNALYSFQRYMPIALVKNLVSSGKVAEVGGETKEVTLLFSDIESFTQISEGMDPEKVMQYLSEYFQAMTKIIIDHDGTVDKYIGDGLMAFWGAPIDDADQTMHACESAIEMGVALYKLNTKWRNEGNPEIKIRIGISTGKVIVGNVGSDDRLSYTALGDTVNLTSRLEALNKTYGTRIIVGERTYESVKDKFKFRLLDKVAVKGKKLGLYIYELIEKENDVFGQELDQYNFNFKKAFDYYEKGDWQNANDQFNELTKQYPNDDVLKIFSERCSIFVKNPPKHWEGVWIKDVKEKQLRILEFFNFYSS